MINHLDLQIAIEYLYEGTSYSKLETKFFHAKQNNHGGKVGTILNNLGIKSQHKAILKYKNIDDEICIATGKYKDTLLEIKKVLAKGITNTSFKPLSKQEEITLKDKLFEKLYEENGIKELAFIMSTLNVSYDFNIKLKLRKKMTTSFYNKVNSFMKKHTPKYVYCKYKDLQILVNDIINADDNKTYHNVLKPYIQEMLEIIIGHNYSKDTIICEKAFSYITQLDKAILIKVLNGEYTETLEKIEDVERYHPVITLYLANIWDYCIDNNFDYEKMIYTVFAHEYLHLHHYHYLHKYNCIENDKAISKYNPGEIIKESLASYFECTYALNKNYTDIANKLIDSWNKNDEDYWPYAGAKKIKNNHHFADIYNSSLISFKKALIIKNK